MIQNTWMVRSEGGPATGDIDTDSAYDFMGYTFDYYWNEHSRDGIDNDGMGETAAAAVFACINGDCANLGSCMGPPPGGD